MAGLTVDQLSASFDARLDNNAQNLILFSGSFNTRIEELQEGSVLGKVNTLSGSHTTLSASFTSNSSSFNSRINTIKASELALSASVSDDVTSITADVDSLNDFSASITSSFNSLSASVSSNSASFTSRINTLRAGGVTFDDFNALTQSLSGVFSSSAQLNNATITNLTITNLTTINETSSVIYSSGSNQFGDNLADNHILSGSVYIVGSGSLNGYTLLTSNNTSSFLTSLNGALSSSAQVLDGSGIFSSSAQLPAGLVSASSQVLDGSGIFSSSAQLPAGLVSASSQLPAGLVSASSQVLDGSGIFSSSAQLPTNLISGSSQISELGFISSSTSIDTGSFATTGSNQFTGSQNINGDVIITGSTLSVKKSTDSDPFFIVDADSKRLALVQGNGEIPGEFYLALSGSSAFFPRPEKTLLYGARGFKFQTNQGTVSEFTGSLTISSSAAVDLNVIGALNVTGSLNVSSSNSINWYMPQLSLYQRNPSEAQSGLTLNHWNNTLDAYSSLQLYAFSNESWIQSTEKILKISGPTVQLSGLNSDPGNVNVIGKLNVTGSIGVSGSIVPAVGSGQYTSSFSLGSPTAAWKDIYVSDGTINFLGSTGNTIGRLSATADGLSALSLLLGTSSFGGNEVPQLYIGQGRTNNPNNVAIGANALNSVDTSGGGADGMFNVAVGSYALSQVAAGQGNTAMGHNAMGGANGYYNTAIGNYAGYAGGGNGNVFVGYNSGRQITNTGAGGGNVALGYEALMSNGTDAYFAANVAIGNRAGYYLSGSSHNNIIIGDRTGPQGSYKQENYKLYIGDGATPLMTGSLESGNLSLSINGATTITTTLTLKPQHPLPTGALGSMAVSGSSLYFHNGTSWKGVLLDA